MASMAILKKTSDVPRSDLAHGVSQGTEGRLCVLGECPMHGPFEIGFSVVGGFKATKIGRLMGLRGI